MNTLQACTRPRTLEYILEEIEIYTRDIDRIRKKIGSLHKEYDDLLFPKNSIEVKKVKGIRGTLSEMEIGGSIYIEKHIKYCSPYRYRVRGKKFTMTMEGIGTRVYRIS